MKSMVCMIVLVVLIVGCGVSGVSKDCENVFDMSCGQMKTCYAQCDDIIYVRSRIACYQRYAPFVGVCK